MPACTTLARLQLVVAYGYTRARSRSLRARPLELAACTCPPRCTSWSAHPLASPTCAGRLPDVCWGARRGPNEFQTWCSGRRYSNSAGKIAQNRPNKELCLKLAPAVVCPHGSDRPPSRQPKGSCRLPRRNGCTEGDRRPQPKPRAGKFGNTAKSGRVLYGPE
jgi:hypothetical protein